MSKWICKEGKATVKELKKRFGDDIEVKLVENAVPNAKEKPKLVKTKTGKVARPRAIKTRKTKPKAEQHFEVKFKPKYWFELQREVWIDEKLRGIFKDVELRVSRSFNGFIENFGISDNITADQEYYLKTGKRKVWIGYKGKELFEVVIKRIFLKGIKMGLIPTAWED